MKHVPKRISLLLAAAACLTASGAARADEVAGGDAQISAHSPDTVCTSAGKPNAQCRVRVNGLPACTFDEDGAVTNGDDYIWWAPNGDQPLPSVQQMFSANFGGVYFPTAHEIWCRNLSVSTQFVQNDGQDGFLMQITVPPGRRYTVEANATVWLYEFMTFIPAGLGELRLEQQQSDGSWQNIASTPMGELLPHYLDGWVPNREAILRVSLPRLTAGKYRAAFRVTSPTGQHYGPWLLNLDRAELKAY